MAEGRIIKESAFTSDSIANLNDFQFRLWVGLITISDNVGRGDARAKIVKGRLFALREKVRESDVERGLKALADNGSIVLYEVAGRPFYEFPHWFDHQRLRKETSKFPGPDDPAATRRNSPQPAATCRLEEEGKRREVEEEEEVEGKINARARTREAAREDEQDPGFTAFWDAYPRKSGDIRQAFMAYLHATADLGASPEEIVTAIKAQTEGVTVEDIQFMPSAEKWLRNKGWKAKGSYKRVQKDTKQKKIVTAAEYKDPTPPEKVEDIWAKVSQI